MEKGRIEHIACYRVLRKLGEGGMGVVFEAEHITIARRVAIKILHPQYATDKSTLTRFFNEARAVNLIDHPGLVQVLDYGQREEDGSSYFVMELLKGETLSARMRSTKAGLSVPRVLSIGRQIAAALAAAHSKGIVHRDLKLDNVMLVPDAEAAEGERVKILDFGIAKLVPDPDCGDVRTSTHAVMGTPAYMAPEQCRGANQVDDRADVYSLGVVLYELLVGRRPFVGRSSGELIGQHLFMAPPAVSQALPTVPFALDALVETLLRKDREQRPRMAEVARRLAEMSELYSSVRQPNSKQPENDNLATQILGDIDIEVLNTGALKAKCQCATSLPSAAHSQQQTAPGSSPLVTRRWTLTMVVLSAFFFVGIVSLIISAPRALRKSTQSLHSVDALQVKAGSGVPRVELLGSRETDRSGNAGFDAALLTQDLAHVSTTRTSQPTELVELKDHHDSRALNTESGKRSMLPGVHGAPHSRQGVKVSETAVSESRVHKAEAPLASTQQVGLEPKGASHEILED